MSGYPHSLALPEVFEFEGQTVRFGRSGTSGPAVVMVHGTPFSSHVWRRIVPWLAQHHRVFYYDLLGYGQSEMSDGQNVSLGIQNGLLAALLAHWGLDNPHVVAHDFGGATALRTYLLNDARYASLTLIDPVALAPWGSPFVQHVRRFEEAFSGLPAYIHHAILPAYIQGATHTPLSAEGIQPYVTPWTGALGQPAFYRQIAQMDQKYTDEIEGRFEEISCPVMLLWGEEDQWIPIERGEALARRIPGSTFIRIPGAGHLMQEDAPEAIVAHVLDFLGA